jgi:cyclopropane fatty-acyl-phospholipid synthase-like methyltransferase
VDVAELKQRHAWIWAQGDYSVLSALLRPAAAALCDACAVSAGQDVLDVAAGDGNFALACAAKGAKVVASDLSPGWSSAAGPAHRRRAARSSRSRRMPRSSRSRTRATTASARCSAP